MKIDFSFMEVVAKPSLTTFANKSLEELKDAMAKSEIHTFGWPIAPVIYSEGLQPKPVTDGIESRVDEPGHRDYWTLRRSGEFYFIGELFENNRKPPYVFLDTRTNRITEAFLRIGNLYSLLGVQEDETVYVMVKHGNIKGKLLGLGNPARMIQGKRSSNVNEVKTEFSMSLKSMTELESLKTNVYNAIRDLAEMFDMFNPAKTSFTDPIVEAFVGGRII